jgi:ABC-type glycerol-3-phosphate transport system permease component
MSPRTAPEELRRAARLRRGRRTWSIPRTVIAVLLAATYVYPFLVMISIAIKPEDEYYENPTGFPTEITFEFVERAWTAANLGPALLNSLLASSIAVVVCVTITSLSAFYFLRNRGRLASVLLGSYGSLWMIPQIVWIIPLFLVLSRLNMIDNLVVLGVVYGAVYAPGFLWLIWAYFLQAIPEELLQAAEVDGASLFYQFWSIVLPLSRPALAIVASLCFVYSWGDLLISVVLLQTPDNFTVVPAAASLVGRLQPEIQEVTAAAVITIAPMIIVFLIAQRAIVRGITAGFSR